jgi:hypothetical protein
MLQIISGKFFKTEDRHKFDGKGITYSNYSWIEPIKTCVATLEPVDTYAPVSSYVISYINQIEKDKDGKPGIVRVGDAEIIKQFELLCIFGLKAYFNINKVDVAVNCRNVAKDMGDKQIPSKFVKRFFDSQIMGNTQEIKNFTKFVDQVIGLPRNKYKIVIKCIYNFVNALQAINFNLDLSYSIFVYCLESLTQGLKNFTSNWADYYPESKDKLDFVLMKINNNIADEIRTILLQSGNFKLLQRFSNFVCGHIDNSFFIDEAEKVGSALRKSELNRVLKNAYALRSRYVHNLKQILKQLEIPAIASADVFHWDNEPYLTINGLVRLTHHVITNFIWRQEYLEREEYNWKKDLPGIYTLAVAPQIWIGKHENFEPSTVNKRFSGFLQNLQDAISNTGSLTDLDKLLEKYESLIPNAKKKDKLSMLAVYCLYNNFIVQSEKRLDYEKFLLKHQHSLNECCIEILITRLLLNQEWPWDIEECVEQYNNYLQNKFSENSLSIPTKIEICLIIEIANNYLRIKKIREYKEWLRRASLESAGKPEIQKLINESIQKNIEIDYNQVLKAN